MLHAVIMAGGSGTRFWPESRGAAPKQLLRLVGERTMIQSTVDRLGRPGAARAGADRDQRGAGRRDPRSNSRSCRRRRWWASRAGATRRPASDWPRWQIVRNDPEGIMAVMPSDHVISPDAAFQQAIAQAAALVEASPERIVTFGIRPTYPAESFGYIERGEPLDVAVRQRRARLITSSSFAKSRRPRWRAKYLAAGTFYWNSGIFVWKAATILRGARRAAAGDVRALENDRRGLGHAATRTPCSPASSRPSTASRSTMP